MSGNVIFEGENAIYFASRAVILDETYEQAWAEKHIKVNPYNSWILGKYVEADRANSNRQRFQLADLRAKRESINYAPLNMNHTPHIVGTMVANELVYPVSEDENAGQPFVEALSAMWKARFTDDYRVVESAHKSGTLFYSMECLPETITCGGETGCQGSFEYAGRQHSSYCEHLNDPSGSSDKIMGNPHFVGGALIVPPHRPGWNNASIGEISQLLEESVAAGNAVEEAAREFENLNASESEQLIAHLVAMDRLLRA